MTDFPNREQIENMGGVVAFYFTPIRYIAAMPLVENMQCQEPVKFVKGKSWLIGYSTPFKSSLGDQGEIVDAGYIFKKPFQGFFPLNTPDALNLFTKMTKEFFVLCVKDSNGRTRLVGSPRQPVIFNFSSSTGDNTADLAGFNFSFSAETELPAPYYINEENIEGSFNNDFNEDFE